MVKVLGLQQGFAVECGSSQLRPPAKPLKQALTEMRKGTAANATLGSPWAQVTHQCRVQPLPRRPSVADILRDFERSKAPEGGAADQSTAEVLEGCVCRELWPSTCIFPMHLWGPEAAAPLLLPGLLS